MASYRRRDGNDTWHFCSNCSKWPVSNYEEQSTEPTSGALCNECKSKQATGNCQ